MVSRIQIWQWPNVLGLDAAVIAVAWMAVFAAESKSCPGAAAYLVLGLSVWLTYLADRLFDTRHRPMRQLISIRHRFVKRKRILLWRLWMLVLVVNLTLAVLGLSETQFWRGGVLLAFCFAYTLLNQRLSKRYFPKEIFVAGIFAAGTQVFLEATVPRASLLLFGLLCLVNCLLIAEKEKAVDAHMHLRSARGQIPLSLLVSILLITTMLGTVSGMRLSLLASSLALTALYCGRHRIAVESYRVLCDAVLLLGPLAYFLAPS